MTTEIFRTTLLGEKRDGSQARRNLKLRAAAYFSKEKEKEFLELEENRNGRRTWPEGGRLKTEEGKA